MPRVRDEAGRGPGPSRTRSVGEAPAQKAAPTTPTTSRSRASSAAAKARRRDRPSRRCRSARSLTTRCARRRDGAARTIGALVVRRRADEVEALSARRAARSRARPDRRGRRAGRAGPGRGHARRRVQDRPAAAGSGPRSRPGSPSSARTGSRRRRTRSPASHGRRVAPRRAAPVEQGPAGARAVRRDRVRRLARARPAARPARRPSVAAGRPLPVLLQVNVDRDPAKAGFDPADVEAATAGARSACADLRRRGPDDDRPARGATAEDARPTFAALRELAGAAAGALARRSGPALSMGMSDDFEVAVEEGATIVRVGRALFGERPQPGA